MSKPPRRVAWITVLAVTFLIGCRTIPIPEFTPIRVPKGLDLETVRLAVIAGVMNYQPAEPGGQPTHRESQIAAEIIDAIRSGGAHNSAGWFVESDQPPVLYAGYQRGTYLLHLKVTYDTEQVQTEIVGSENLNQSKTRIHKAVPGWVARMEVRVRQWLSYFALRR